MSKHIFFTKMDGLGLALTYDDVRLKSGYSAAMPKDVSLQTRFSRRVPLRVPIVSSAMDTVTEAQMAMALATLGGLGIIHRSSSAKAQAAEVARVKLIAVQGTALAQANVDDTGHLLVGAAIGVGDEALGRAVALVDAGVDVLVIDTAHGDSAPVYATIEALRERFPETDLVVGNISEPESALRLINAGVDGLKVGQGPGSICTTRVVAGIGAPQVTAVYDCSRIAELHDVPVCADGGVRYSGDITIAIGAGAHSVMLGGMLAGTAEAPGERVEQGGRRWKRYRGMGSRGALMANASSRERYRQQGKQARSLVPEGVEGLVPYRGALDALLEQYIGGLRAGMGYVGAASIDELREKADFHRISYAGTTESHPHDIWADPQELATVSDSLYDPVPVPET